MNNKEAVKEDDVRSNTTDIIDQNNEMVFSYFALL